MAKKIDPKKKKIIVNDPNDPRLRAYQDSLNAYNIGRKNWQTARQYGRIGSDGRVYYDDSMVNNIPNILPLETSLEPEEYHTTHNYEGRYNRDFPQYKRPEQEVIYQKEREKIKPIDKPESKGIEPLRMTTVDDMEYIPGAKIPEYWNLERKVVTPTGVNHQRGRINSQKEFNYYNNLKQGEVDHPTGRGNSTTITPVYHNISPILRNKQQFALGGNLNKQNNMNNNLNQFNVGGSHESNPYGGVPIGMGENGYPNTVEQGETMQNDFVFSDRIVLRPDVISQVGLPKTLANKTVAEATKIIDKQFKDRNSKIDKSTRDAMYDRIAQAQEIIKAEEQAKIAQALEANSTEVPDMMGGEIPQGMDQFMSPEQGMGQLPMEVQDGRVQSGMQDFEQPMFKYGGKVNKYFLGGLFGGNKGNAGNEEQGPNKMMKFLGSKEGSSMMGGIGTAVGGMSGGSYAKQMKKNEEAGFVDNKLAKDQANEQMIEGTLDSVSSAFGPFGQAFRGIQKMGKGIGDSIGGDAGAAISGIFSPEAATMSNLTNPDLNFGQKMLGTIPGVGGVIASRAAKKRAEKEAENRERKAFYDEHIASATMNNDSTQVFAYGGKVNKYPNGGPVNPYKFNPNNINEVKGLQSWGNANKPGWLNNNPNPKYGGMNGVLPENHPDYGIYGRATKTLPISEYEAYMNSLQNQNNTSSYDPSQDIILQNMNKYNGQSEVPMGPMNYNQDVATGGTHFGKKINPYSNENSEETNNNKSGNNLGSMLRYAPILMNAFQLNTLGAPQVNRLKRLNNEYQRQFLDEAVYQNMAREQAAATRNAIARSGATPGQMIGAQLGTQLGATKSIADAYNQIRQHNIGENRLRQQTRFGNNQFNIQQDNLEQDINDRNRAAWQNNRSRLLGQMGTDFGNIGKEETYKDIAIAATGYDWMGKYMQGNPNATKEEVTKAYKKANPKATQKEIDAAYNRAKKNSSYQGRSDQEQAEYLQWILDNNLQHQYKNGAIDYSRFDEYKQKTNSNRLGGILNRKLR